MFSWPTDQMFSKILHHGVKVRSAHHLPVFYCDRTWIDDRPSSGFRNWVVFLDLSRPSRRIRDYRFDRCHYRCLSYPEHSTFMIVLQHNFTNYKTHSWNIVVKNVTINPCEFSSLSWIICYKILQIMWIILGKNGWMWGHLSKVLEQSNDINRKWLKRSKLSLHCVMNCFITLPVINSTVILWVHFFFHNYGLFCAV
jgi:hypothetical protein